MIICLNDIGLNFHHERNETEDMNSLKLMVR